MFFPRSRPQIVREEQLRSLRLTLNSPALAVGEVPAGPARAAIAVHEEAGGSLALCVVVLSLGSGVRACWCWDEAIEPVNVVSATDAALSFAESMGFLFDDDALASESPEARRVAVDQWWELVGLPAPETPAAPGVSEAATEAVVTLDMTEQMELPSTSASREGLPLTKFRRRLGPHPAAPAAPAPKPRASALGRMRLIKRARRGEAGERPSLWLRLLGSF